MLKCFRCSQEITAKKFYIFVGDCNNSYFCKGCRDDEVEEMYSIDPEVAPLWAKNFRETNHAQR